MATLLGPGVGPDVEGRRRPQETSDGDYIAVPIDRWVADGHSYTKIVPTLDKIVPTLDAMLARRNVTPVVIDAADPDN